MRHPLALKVATGLLCASLLLNYILIFRIYYTREPTVVRQEKEMANPGLNTLVDIVPSVSSAIPETVIRDDTAESVEHNLENHSLLLQNPEPSIVPEKSLVIELTPHEQEVQQEEKTEEYKVEENKEQQEEHTVERQEERTSLDETNSNLLIFNSTITNSTITNSTITNSTITEDLQNNKTRKVKILKKIGNSLNDEIFQQSKERKRLPREKSEIVDIPHFSTLKIMEGTEEFISLNKRLISTSKEYDLIILMPSLARINKETKIHASYLIEVLEEYEKQLKNLPKESSVLFLVHAFMNEKTHKVFYKAAKRFKNVKEFVFFIPPFRFKDPYADIPGIDYASPNNGYPGKMARQQTCDVLTMTKFVLQNFQFKYMMYTEDDFLPCENMLTKTFNHLKKIENYHKIKRFEFEKGFCAMKITIGLGGLVFSRPYATKFLEYSKNHLSYEPVDILIQFIGYEKDNGYSTCLQSGLTYYSSGPSLLKHIGHESNWKERNNKKIFGGRDVKCDEIFEKGPWFLGKLHSKDEPQRGCVPNNDIRPCVP